MNDYLTDDELAIGWQESRRASRQRQAIRTEQIRRSNATWSKWLNRVVIIGGSIVGLTLISWLVER